MAERFSAIERTVLSQEIAKRILGLIQDGQISPGEKLPPERKLAELLGVSRPSVREALRALQFLDVIEVKQGDGTYVSSLKPEQLARPVEVILRLLQDVTYLEILEARWIIEPGIAGLAAERITEDELAELESGLQKSERSVDNPTEFLVADRELHSVIVEASQNPLLISLYASIINLGISTRERTVYISGVRESTLAYHTDIVEAIAKHDPLLSKKAMREHLEDIKARLQENFQQQEL